MGGHCSEGSITGSRNTRLEEMSWGWSRMEACFEGESGPRRGCGAWWTFVVHIPILLCITLEVQNLVSCHRLLEKLRLKYVKTVSLSRWVWNLVFHIKAYPNDFKTELWFPDGAEVFQILVSIQWVQGFLPRQWSDRNMATHTPALRLKSLELYFHSPIRLLSMVIG
jgi:hypothetical protein